MSFLNKCFQTALLAIALNFLVQPIQARVIQIATVVYEPFSSPELREGGFQTALLRAAFKAAGHEPIFTFYPWKRALAMTIAGKADFVTSIFFNEERNKVLLFSQTVYVSEIGLIGLKSLNVSHYSSLEDLEKYRIGVLAGAIYEDKFDKADNLQKIVVHEDKNGVPMLFNNRVDLVATNFIYFQNKVAQSDRHDVNELQIVRPSLSVRPAYVAASRRISDHSEIIADFNRGMASIKADGTFDRIAASFGILELNDGSKAPDNNS